MLYITGTALQLVHILLVNKTHCLSTKNANRKDDQTSVINKKLEKGRTVAEENENSHM